MDIPVPRETGLWKRGVLWLLLLGPLFFASYGFANWLTTQRDDVGSLVFAWENAMPLWPWSIVPYWSIDLLYGLSFLLPATRREMDRHALRLLSAQLICVTCFLLWPLRFTFERPELSGVFGWMFDVLMGFDKPFNQAPSLHIALLVVIWVMFARHTHGLLLRGLLHGWMALIGLSVLTTWQHHFIDVPTGILAGWLCAWLWPIEGRSPLQQLRLARTAQRWRLALRYGFGAALCTALAVNLGGAWLWLLWPACALLLVALNYACIGAEGFQKQASGRLSQAALWLFAPYLAQAPRASRSRPVGACARQQCGCSPPTWPPPGSTRACGPVAIPSRIRSSTASGSGACLGQGRPNRSTLCSTCVPSCQSTAGARPTVRCPGSISARLRLKPACRQPRPSKCCVDRGRCWSAAPLAIRAVPPPWRPGCCAMATAPMCHRRCSKSSRLGRR